MSYEIDKDVRTFDPVVEKNLWLFHDSKLFKGTDHRMRIGKKNKMMEKVVLFGAILCSFGVVP